MLATVLDLQSFLGSGTVDSTQANLLLQIATSVVQSSCGQTLTYVENDTVALVPYNNEIILPERPVVGVTAVQGLASGEWQVIQDTIRPTYLLDGSTNSVWWTGREITEDPWYQYVAQLPWPTVQVTYSHGYQSIPDDLRGVCLTIAARLFGNPQGLQSESVGNAQTRYDRAGGAGLTDFEQLVINRYRRTGSTVRLLERPMHTNQF